jgi:molecular chaperone IbpA
MTQLVRFDTNALNTLNRALIGFDGVFNDFERRFSNQISNNYPPYNVVKVDEDNYEIQIAVTGYNKDEVTVEVDQSTLIITGEKVKIEDTNIEYLHRGLAQRDFVRQFQLAEYMEVMGAEQRNGVLTVKVHRHLPEALKPRRIEIQQGE